MNDKYYKIGYDHAKNPKLDYWKAHKEFDRLFPEFVGKGSWQACSWADGWNKGKADIYDNQLTSDMTDISNKYGFSNEELDVLKRFFTDSLQKQINDIKRYT